MALLPNQTTRVQSDTIAVEARTPAMLRCARRCGGQVVEALSAWLLMLLAAAALAGCGGGGAGLAGGAAGSAAGGGGGGARPMAATAPARVGAGGVVHGGQSPVIGSEVTAYAAGMGVGYGQGATTLACVKTDANGSFLFGTIGTPGVIACDDRPGPTSFSCPGSGSPDYIYLIARGGNPGLGRGMSNAALMMMTAVGQCGGAPGGSIPPAIVVNEVTTVASAYALARFMISGTAWDIGTSATNLSGLANAFATVNNLVDIAAGSAPGPGLPAGATVATATINSLANSIAACVDSPGMGSAACAALVCDATPGGSYAGGSCNLTVAGGNTLSATLSIALNPGIVNVNGIYNLATPFIVFSPSLDYPPYDWTIPVLFTAGGFYVPAALAVDGGGNVWVANSFDAAEPFAMIGSVSKLGPTGAPAAGFPAASSGVINGLALDRAGNAWVSNAEMGYPFTGSVSRFGPDGSLTGNYIGGGIDQPGALAVDESGDIWIGNRAAAAELDANGNPLSPSGGFDGGGSITSPIAVAIDAGGDAWMADATGGPYSVGAINELSPLGSRAVGAPFTGGGLDLPSGIAIDAAGNIWAPNRAAAGGTGPGSLTELLPGGAPAPGSPFTDNSIGDPLAVAIDGAGQVWMAGQMAVTELVGGNTPPPSCPAAPVAGDTGCSLAPNGFLGAANSVAIDQSGNVWLTTDNGMSGVTELVGAATPVRTPLIGPPALP